MINFDQKTLDKLKPDNILIENIVSIGPIVCLQSDVKQEFKHLVSMTIPPPPGGNKGHLNIVTIKADNSCAPVAVGYRQRNGCITANMWNLEGYVYVYSPSQIFVKHKCPQVQKIQRGRILMF